MTKTTTTTTTATLTDALAKIVTIREELNERFIERNNEIDVVLASLVSRQHCLLLGPAGEGKSAIVDAVRARVTGAQGFKKLVTKTTTPDEIFGMFDIPSIKAGHYRRVWANRLPVAHIAFLDEIFKSGSALLNSLLDAMNERETEQDGVIETIPLLTLVGASNELPQSDDLNALWDRFVLRDWVQPVSKAGRVQFIEAEMTRRAASASGVDTTGKSGTTISLDEIKLLQNAALRVEIPANVRAAYLQIEEELEAQRYESPSIRRLGWLWSVVAASALLNGRTTARLDDLMILRYALWQQKAQIATVNSVILSIAAPITAKATKTYDAAVEEVQKTVIIVRNAQTREDETKGRVAVMETKEKLADALKELRAHHNEAVGASADTTEIVRMGNDLKAKFEMVARLAGDVTPDW